MKTKSVQIFILLLIGINLMMKQTKKGYFIIVFSIIISSVAIFLFIRNFPHNWYYPLVGYIFGFYVIGFLALLGNTFAGVILWIIGSKSDFTVKEKEEKPRLYTDEEIRRDIEEATKKSIETAVAELQFEIEDTQTDILIGRNVSKTPGININSFLTFLMSPLCCIHTHLGCFLYFVFLGYHKVPSASKKIIFFMILIVPFKGLKEEYRTVSEFK